MPQSMLGECEPRYWSDLHFSWSIAVFTSLRPGTLPTHSAATFRHGASWGGRGVDESLDGRNWGQFELWRCRCTGIQTDLFLIILLSWLGLNELSCMGTGTDLSQTQLVVFHRFPLAIRPSDYEKIGNAVQTSWLSAKLVLQPRTCRGEERLGRSTAEDSEGSTAAERGRVLWQCPSCKAEWKLVFWWWW